MPVPIKYDVYEPRAELLPGNGQGEQLGAGRVEDVRRSAGELRKPPVYVGQLFHKLIGHQ